jgi:hypothetical protein
LGNLPSFYFLLDIYLCIVKFIYFLCLWEHSFTLCVCVCMWILTTALIHLKVGFLHLVLNTFLKEIFLGVCPFHLSHVCIKVCLKLTFKLIILLFSHSVFFSCFFLMIIDIFLVVLLDFDLFILIGICVIESEEFFCFCFCFLLSSLLSINC